MRVLVINTTAINKGGITNVIFNLARKIDKTDIVFDMLAPKAEFGSLVEEFCSFGGDVYIVPRSIKKAVQYIMAVKKLIKKNNYDIVHIHGNSHTVVLELLAAKLAGCKTRIVHAHSTKCLDMRLHKAMTGLFDKLCTHRVACGEDAGKFMFGEKPFTVINNGIDLNAFLYNEASREIIRRKHNLDGKFVIGHMGLFSENKNQTFLIDALEEILKTNKNYALLLVGDGETREKVCEKAKELGVSDSVVFAGFTDNPSGYLSAFDIFTLPSFFEGLPLVLVEAQASGLHSVVSDSVTTEADKTGNMSFLSLNQGAKVWAEEIMKYQDCANRQAVSENAANILTEKGYSIETEAGKLLSFYKNAVKD